MTQMTEGLDALFAGKDAAVRATYDRLLEVLRTFGSFREEPKKTSISSGQYLGVCRCSSAQKLFIPQRENGATSAR